VLHEEARELVRQLRDAAGSRDLVRLAGLYADDAVAVSPVFGTVRGAHAIVETWGTLLTTFSDITLDISDILVDGDRIAVLATVNTTDRAGWFGRPATHAPINYRMVLLLTVRQGTIVYDERIYDSAGVLERLEKARLDKELRTAADVQRALMSRTAHAAPFCEAVGDSVPCRAIGGDFFEFIERPNGDVGIAMGDVSGKGPAAALLAAMLQGMLAVEAASSRSPAETLSRINTHLIARRVESRFATLVYGVLSRDGRFVYSNAGHNPPVLHARNGIRRLDTGGPIVGVFDDVVFEDETLCLDRHDTLVMYTDGVIEARSAQGEEFGEDRLIARLVASQASPPATLLRGIFDEVRAFCDQTDQGDDITVTVTRFLHG
jgi:sigma-B regulation protein RsbU (phosphoserine phosphatase)